MNPLPSEEDGEAGEKQNSDAPKAEEDVVDISSPAVSETDKEAARLRAVLNANIGACFVKLVCGAYAALHGRDFILYFFRVTIKRP